MFFVPRGFCCGRNKGGKKGVGGKRKNGRRDSKVSYINALQ